MKIRKGSIKDFDEMIEIIIKEYAKKPYNEKWTKKRALRTLKYYFVEKRDKCFVAVVNKRVVGFIIFKLWLYYKDFAYIEDFVVDSDFQGKGIGRALMEKVGKFAQKNKACSIFLRTDKNAKARGFYKALGFVPDDGILLTKELKKC